VRCGVSFNTTNVIVASVCSFLSRKRDSLIMLKSSDVTSFDYDRCRVRVSCVRIVGETNSRRLSTELYCCFNDERRSRVRDTLENNPRLISSVTYLLYIFPFSFTYNKIDLYLVCISVCISQ